MNVSRLHQKWIDEAMVGTLRPGSIERLKKIAAKARTGAGLSRQVVGADATWKTRGRNHRS